MDTTQQQDVFHYGGQQINRERGRFWIYCLAKGFFSLSAAKRWIDRNICPDCKCHRHDCECDR